MKRQNPLLTLGVALWLALCSNIVLRCDGDDRPNIIVVLVDDMGVMDSSVPFLTDVHGKPQRYPLNDYYRTPNMERLASQGVRFSNFCAMSVCSPTRISIMTGQNAARHRTTNWIDPDRNNAGPKGPPQWNWRGLDKNDLTLPRLLQASGYRTIHVGKGHFGPRNSEGANPLQLGFDINVGGTSIGQPASYYGTANYGNAGGSIEKTSPHAVPGLEKYHGTDTFLTDALTQEAKRHISQSIQDGKPFFLNFAHYAVHAPFHSDPRFLDHYRGQGKSEQAMAYASLIEGMDESLGAIMNHVETLGVAEDALLIFLGDNGTDAPLGDPHAVACAAPLRGKKGSHYEGGMRSPLILSWIKPNASNAHQQNFPIAHNGVQNQLAAVYDLFPTIVRLAGGKVPIDHIVDGIDLKNLLNGKPDPTRPEKFLMHYPHAPHRSDYFTSIREGEWKLIYHYYPSKGSEDARYQLYHLKRDPFERTNLADSHRPELLRMMESMKRELKEQGALYPLDDSGEPLLPE